MSKYTLVDSRLIHSIDDYNTHVSTAIEDARQMRDLKVLEIMVLTYDILSTYWHTGYSVKLINLANRPNIWTLGESELHTPRANGAN